MGTIKSKGSIGLFLCALMLSVNTSVGAIDPNLVGWWTFNEGSGTVVEDIGHRGIDGDLFGAPQWDTAGIHGGSLLFDGDDDYVFIDGKYNFPAYTIGIWFRVDSSGQRDIVSAYAVGVQHGILLELTTDGTLRYLHRFPLGTGGGSNFYTTDSYDDGAWYHAAMVKTADDITLYIDGEVAGSTPDNSKFDATDQFGVALGVLDDERGVNRLFLGAMDDLRIYDRALTEAEVKNLLKRGNFSLSGTPLPADTATDVPQNAVLTWAPGEYAVTHTVYFGNSLEDVNNANASTLVAENIDVNNLDIGRLDFDQTYYWRVDEVNGAPDFTTFAGETWSFTVEPEGIPVEGITATASGDSAGMEASKTIDGSGLNELDEHSAIPTEMWLTTTEASWIQYEFDTPHKLRQMLVWNSNQVIEPFIGFGVKDVIVETSLDGATWTQVEGASQFAQAPGKIGYQANTTVELASVLAKYVKITPQSAYGFTGQSGLSEVRFLAIPTYARELAPANGDSAASVEADLTWRAGREAASHQINLGTEADNLTLAGTTDETVFTTDALDYARTYYWQVIEINELETPANYVGDVAEFMTPAFSVVDDFESYSGEEGQEVFMTWLDGFGGDASLGGSTTGHISGPFVETGNANNGRQSMPVYYDNDGGFFDIDGNASSPTSSEVLRVFDAPQDWSAGGLTTLSIAFYGAPDNTGQLYCKIGDTKLVYDGDAANLALEAWTIWSIDLSAAGIDYTRVNELAIGIEGGGSGILYLDDIQLAP